MKVPRSPQERNDTSAKGDARPTIETKHLFSSTYYTQHAYIRFHASTDVNTLSKAPLFLDHSRYTWLYAADLGCGTTSIGSICPHKKSRPRGISCTLARVVYGARAAEPTKPAPPKEAILRPPLPLPLLAPGAEDAAVADDEIGPFPPPSRVRQA